MAPSDEIILFHYPFSPYARRVISYLTLRGIPYKQCIQPPTLPRPDLSALNIAYRRIPLLAIGADIYLDSRLIIDTLDRLYPSTPSNSFHSLATADPSGAALAALLRTYTCTAGLFERAAQLLPPDLPLVKDPKFQADRADFSGRPWSAGAMRKARPEALAHVRTAFQFMEDTVLGDGRSWVCGGREEEGPSIADVEAAWLFGWVQGFPDKEVQRVLGKERFPRVGAWVARFEGAVKAAKRGGPKVGTVKGREVLEMVRRAGSTGSGARVDAGDPLALKEGEEVEVWPIESGFRHRDRGRLVGLTREEVVVEKIVEGGGKIRIHAPRVGFRVQRVEASKL